jgi:hypothetical protein
MSEAPPPPEWVAYEEASHAVAMVKLGVGGKIKLATIKPGRGSWGRVEHQKILHKGDEDSYQSSPAAMARIECAILVHLAGQYGPHRIAPDTYRLSRNTPDYKLVNDLISHLYPSLYDQDNVWPLYLSYMEARAKRLVWQYWKEIEAVAKALLERETLTRDEIIAVMYRANGLPPPGSE